MILAGLGPGVRPLGPHVPKVYVSHGKMNELRPSFCGHGGAHAPKVYDFHNKNHIAFWPSLCGPGVHMYPTCMFSIGKACFVGPH